MVRRLIRQTVTRHEISTGGGVIAYARKKRLGYSWAVGEIEDGDPRFTVTAQDEHRPQEGLVVAASQQRPSIGEVGTVAGSFLGPRRWQVRRGDGEPVDGRERRWVAAFFRAFTWLEWLLPTHFDFTVDGKPAFTVHKKAFPPMRYEVSVTDPELDRRLVVAAVLALDYF